MNHFRISKFLIIFRKRVQLSDLHTFIMIKSYHFIHFKSEDFKLEFLHLPFVYVDTKYHHNDRNP